MIVSEQNFYCLFIGILNEPFDVTCLQEEEPVKEEPPVETEEDEEKKKKQVGDCGSEWRSLGWLPLLSGKRHWLTVTWSHSCDNMGLNPTGTTCEEVL